jgi:hypothetical protein
MNECIGLKATIDRTNPGLSDLAKDGYCFLDEVVAMTTHAKPMAAAAVRMLLKTSHRSSKI